MWADAGLVRDGAGLEHAASVIAAWRAQTRTPATEAEFEDENLLQVAAAVVAAALARPESVGAHARRDSAARVTQSPRAADPASAPISAESGAAGLSYEHVGRPDEPIGAH